MGKPRILPSEVEASRKLLHIYREWVSEQPDDTDLTFSAFAERYGVAEKFREDGKLIASLEVMILITIKELAQLEAEAEHDFRARLQGDDLEEYMNDAS